MTCLPRRTRAMDTCLLRRRAKKEPSIQLPEVLEEDSDFVQYRTAPSKY